MKNRLLTLAGALALLMVLGKFYAKPLFAQVRAALIKNVDERGRIPFQVTGTCTPLIFDDFCDVIFPAIPAGKRLVIEHVNVDVDSANNTAPELVLYQDVSGGASAVLPVFLRNGSDYGSNEAVLMYVEAGQSPKLRAVRLPFPGLVNTAAISGYLIDLSM